MKILFLPTSLFFQFYRIIYPFTKNLLVINLEIKFMKREYIFNEIKAFSLKYTWYSLKKIYIIYQVIIFFLKIKSMPYQILLNVICFQLL